ncbi:MAG: YkgJ family cysteine cluster protein [Candidatus Hodarchaeota archaeon]
MPNGQICRESNCHQCCTETEMLITKKDIRKIDRATGIKPSEYVVLTTDGHRMLRNYIQEEEETCYFLDSQGKCRIYDIKPEGCQFYPIIWDLERHLAIKDDFCPHCDKFELDEEKSSRLETFILRLYGTL